MENITLFENHTDYQTAVNDNLLIYPNVSYCIEEDELHYKKYSPSEYDKQYFTLEIIEAGTVEIYDNPGRNVNIKYSSDDGDTWTSLTTARYTNSLGNFDAGTNIMFKGVNNLFGDVRFVGTAKINVSGNIMSLLYGDDFIGKTTFPTNNQYALNALFYKSNKIISAEHLILPATILAPYCYEHMFYQCTSLTTAPELPAATLATYCYWNMFYGCTSLTTAPELPATTLASSCYQSMFSGCTSLEKAPALPATTLVQACYYHMFYGCSSLNYIKCMATSGFGAGSTTDWVTGVAATGTFVSYPNTTWSSGKNGIPSGWTVQDAT